MAWRALRKGVEGAVGDDETVEAGVEGIVERCKWHCRRG